MAQGTQVCGADVEGGAEGGELCLDFGVEGFGVGREGYAAFPVVCVLVGREMGWGSDGFGKGWGDGLCDFDRLDACALVHLQQA